VLLLLVLTNLVYAFMLLVTIPKVMDFSNGMKPMDMMPMGYSVDYVVSLLIVLGNQGRDIYLFNQIPADMLYPMLFGISYCLLFAYFLNKMGKLDSLWFYLCLLPILAGGFDYLENIGIIVLLANFPDITAWWITVTAVFTVLKSMISTVYFIALIVMLLIFAYRKAMMAKINR
jgi:hypothetical protein